MIEKLAQIYSGKKVLITGHTGFKGSWLAMMLQRLGSELKGIALPPENDALYESIGRQLEIDSVYCDIRSFDQLKKEVLNFEPHYIFHLAAQPIVLRGYNEPRYTMDVNIMGTCNVLEIVRQLSYQCKVIVVTTDKVYEDTHSNKTYKERDRIGGSDPYSGSKAACELVTSSYVKSYFNHAESSLVGVARAGNVIGGGDYSEDRIVPDIICALRTKQKVLIRNPYAVRPWQHVIDPLYGYLLFAAQLEDTVDKSSFAFNFGPDPSETIVVEDLVKACIGQWGEGTYEIMRGDGEYKESNFLKLDSSSAHSDLNWRPTLNSRDAITHTIDWYKNVHLKSRSPYQTTAEQIESFGKN